MDERGDLTYRAHLAEQSERFNDMVDAMTKVAKMDQELSVQERNLLSVAYKNVIGPKRSSLRILFGMQQKSEAKGGTNRDIIEEMKNEVQSEISKVCKDILDLLQSHLLPNLQSKDGKEYAESKVFYHKMCGDYYRYLAEYTEGEDKKNNSTESMTQYEKAHEVAVNEKLEHTNPIRLGLALNYSVFHYEILNNPDMACKIAKEAFDEAIESINDNDCETYKDSTLIMQLLRDNLTLWNQSNNDDQEQDVLEDLEQKES